MGDIDILPILEETKEREEQKKIEKIDLQQSQHIN
jgi:hypothetical protein